MLVTAIVCLLLMVATNCNAGTIRRKKRGLLARTGICPSPVNNFQVIDTRLNFYGVSIVLPGTENPPCTANDCSHDAHCDGDRKCCRNHCGGQVCTEAVREPHPCELFTCPATKVCKIQRIQCIDPYCPDMYSVSRPVCVYGGPIYEVGRRSRIPRPNLLFYDLKKRTQIPKEVVFSPEAPWSQEDQYRIPI